MSRRSRIPRDFRPRRFLPRGRYLTGASYPLARAGWIEHEYVWGNGRQDSDTSSGGSTSVDEFGRVHFIRSSATTNNYGSRFHPVMLWLGQPGSGYSAFPLNRQVVMISRFYANAPL